MELETFPYKRGPRHGSGARTPRVLFVSHYAGKTGAPLLLLHFLRWVHDHTSMRFEVLLLETGPLTAAFGELGRVHVVNRFGEPDPSSLEAKARTLGWHQTADRRQGLRIARETSSLGRFDAVFVNSAMAVEALRLLPDVPTVVVTWLHETDTAFSQFISRADRALVLTESDWLITCADGVSHTLVGRFDVATDRIRRHYGFVSPMEPDRVAGRRVREQLGIADTAIVVGGIGVLQWRKGPDLFVEVAAEVVRRRPDLDIHFLWAGGGDPHGDEPPVLDDAAHMGIADRVHVLGEYDSAAEMFGAFDLFCLSSREDPFPLVMLEAGLLEVPIVAFANGGVVEFAKASSDPSKPLAVVVDYLDVDGMAEAVVALADDPVARAELAERARRHVEAEHLTEVAAPRLYEELRRLDPVFRWPKP